MRVDALRVVWPQTQASTFNAQSLCSHQSCWGVSAVFCLFLQIASKYSDLLDAQALVRAAVYFLVNQRSYSGFRNTNCPVKASADRPTCQGEDRHQREWTPERVDTRESRHQREEEIWC